MILLASARSAAKSSRVAIWLLTGLVWTAVAGSHRLLGQSAETNDVRFVTLAPKEIATRIDENWQAIPRKTIDQLLAESRRKSHGPAAVQVQKAEYRATFNGNDLAAGTIELNVQRNSRNSKWLDLGGCNLSLTKLGNTDGETVWGRSPAGRLLAQIDTAGEPLIGRWTMSGRSQGTSRRFDLQLVPAAASRLTIRAPNGWRIEVPEAEVSQQQPQDKSGLRTWRIDISGRSSITLLASKQITGRTVPRSVLMQSDARYEIRENALRMEYRATLNVLNAPVRTVQFQVPKSVSIYRVDYRATTSLDFTRRLVGQNQLVTVRLPDSLIGKSRRITIYGVTRAALSTLWTLPAVTMPGTDFVGGDVHLQVFRPLHLGRIATSGLRQSTPLLVTAGDESLSFQQDRARSRLRVQVSREPARLRCVETSRIAMRDQRCRLTTFYSMSAAKAAASSVRIQVGRDWTVTEVTAFPDLDEAEGLAVRWSESRLSNRVRLLTVPFPARVSTGKTIRLRIVAESTSAFARRRIRIPVLTPLDTIRTRTSIVVDRNAGLIPVVSPNGTFRQLSPNAASEFLKTQTSQPIPAGQSPPLVLQSSATAPRGSVELRRRSGEYDASAWTICSVEPRGIRERHSIRLTTPRRQVRRIPIFVSRRGPVLHWHDAANPSKRLTARRLPIRAVSTLQLPTVGEVWEVEIPVSKQPGIRLVAEAFREQTAALEPAVVFVPTAQRFAGLLEVQIGNDRDATTNGFFPVTNIDAVTVHRPATETKPGRLWRYQSPRASIRFAADSRRAATTPVSVRVFDLWTVLSPVAGGRDRHRAIFELQTQSSAGRMVWNVPSEIRINRVRVNGNRAAVTRVGGLLRVDDIPPSRANTIELEFETDSISSGWSAIRTIPLPTTTAHIGVARWHLASPRHLRPDNGTSSNVLVPLPASTGWARRFFGPLARRAESKQRIKPHSDRPADFAIPNNWNVYHVSMPTMPGVIRFQLTNREIERRWAWIGLFTCLLVGWGIRRWQMPSRARFGVWWLAVCLIAAILAPEFAAEFVGACILGSLVAVLTPRRLIRRDSVIDYTGLGIPVGSTASYPRVAGPTQAMLALLVVGLLSVVSVAQPMAKQGAEDNRQPAVSRRTILVPPAKNGEMPRIVYVHRALLSSLKTTVATRVTEPKYLIRHADYEVETVDVDSADMTARFEVVTLPGASGVELSIPLTNAHLCGSRACRVNGQYQPVRRADSGRGFLIGVKPSSNSRKSVVHQVELCLRLALQGDVKQRRIRVGIPAVPSSRIRMTSAFDSRKPGIPQLSNAVQENVWFTHTITGDVGPVSHLQLRWNSAESESSQQSSGKVDLHTIVDVGPTLTTYRYHLRYHSLTGPVGAVEMRIPDNWSVHSISTTDAGEDAAPLRFRSTQQKDKTRRVTAALPDVRSKPFRITAEFVSPNRSRALQLRLHLPRLHDMPTTNGGASRFVESAHLVAVTTAAEYRLTFSPVRATELKPIPEEAQNVFRPFLSGTRSPRAAFQLVQPSSIRGRIARVEPGRIVDLSHSITADIDRVTVKMSASVDITEAAAFKHELNVPNGLEIESVEVISQGAPRIAKWVRIGSRLAIFLSEKSTGNQTVLLKGSLRVPLHGRVTMPVVKFQNAKTGQSRIEVFRSSNVGLQFIGDTTALRVDGPRARVNRGNWFVAAFDGRSAELPELRPLPRDETLQIDRLTRVSRLNSGKFRLDYLYRFEEATPRSGIRLVVPVSLKLQPGDGMDSFAIEKTPQADGTIAWLLRSRTPVSKGVVSLKAELTAPESSRDWVLPAPSIPAAKRKSNHLSVDKSLTPWHAASEFKPVPTAQRLNWYKKLVGKDSIVYQGNGRNWRLSKGRPRSAQRGIAVGLMESWVWKLEDRPRVGRTDLYIQGFNNEPLNLRWPASLELTGVRLNGRLLAVKPMNSGRLTIPLNEMSSAFLRIDWRQKQSRRLPAVAFARLELPRVIDVQPARVFVRVATSGKRRFSGFSNGTPQPPIAMQIERIVRLIAYAKGTRSFGAAPTQAWHTARRAYSALTNSARRRIADDETLSQLLVQIENDLTAIADKLPPTPIDSDPGFELASSATIWQGEVDPTQTEVQYLALDRQLIRVLIALVAVGLVLPLAFMLFRLELGDKLARWDPLSWAALGTVWWLFLTPWFAGPALLLIAGMRAAFKVIRRWRGDPVIHVYDQSAA